MPNQLGKRYECKNCGATVLVTKGGTGEVQCCGTPMELLAPKKLPSAD